MLQKEAVDLESTTKDLKLKMEEFKSSLDADGDYSEQELEDAFDPEENEVEDIQIFVDEFRDDIIRLRNACTYTVNYCKESKKRLTDALIFDRLEEDELAELASTDTTEEEELDEAEENELDLEELDDYLEDELSDFEEDELTELAGEAALMGDFYNTLAPDCTNFYRQASNKFKSDADNMKDTITAIGKHKHVIMNYAREHFNGVKI